MSKELNDIRKLAGLKPLVESTQLDELSPKTLKSYAVKAKNQANDLHYAPLGDPFMSDEEDAERIRVQKKRDAGVAQAKQKVDKKQPVRTALKKAFSRKPAEEEVEEEVDHTRYGNESHPQSYELGSFDNKGRASLPNRYVQSRYGDNPLKNAKQIAKESEITLESLAAEFDRYLSEGYSTEECDDADEDIMVQAKDQLDEINLDESDVSGPKFSVGDTIRRIGSETAIAKVLKVDINPYGDAPEQAVYQLYWTNNETTTKLDSDVIDDSYELHNAISEDDVSNFSSDDIKQLERIRDVSAAKQKAIELISRQSARSMKPNKVAWFKRAIMGKNSVGDVIKLMYDLMLSGEGHGVVGSSGSMKPNSYRKQFGEDESE